MAGGLVKVILENAYLSKDEIVRGSKAVEAAGADFVKTSTGFAPSGATLDDLRLMRESVSPRVRVKAAGGVRSLDALLEVIERRGRPLRRDPHGRDARRLHGASGRSGAGGRSRRRGVQPRTDHSRASRCDACHERVIPGEGGPD